MPSASGISRELAERLGLSVFVVGELVRRLAALPGLDRAVIYGSRARGDYRTHSDIDIALIGSRVTDRDRMLLGFSIEDSPVLFDVDLTLYDKLVADHPLRQRIDRDGVVIYERALAPA